jgi:hypothetical protein
VKLLFLSSCSCNNEPSPHNNFVQKPVIPTPGFIADSAYEYVRIQVAFGPRVPNTKPHIQCGDYLIETLKRFSDTVIVQSAVVNAFNNTPLQIRNIIASYNPGLKNRILICAHWDTRPFADRDSVNRDKPIDGANDGASGVGVILEIARQLHSSSPDAGIDLLLFDAEDYGQPDDSPLPKKNDSYCLGSQYWSRNLHVPGYYASAAILLDMVGAANATFLKEGTSMEYAPEIMNTVWATAARLGYSGYFLQHPVKPIVDDHFYINHLTGIPAIDIIHLDETTPFGFFPHHHTHGDNMSIIDRNTLKAVGQTVLEFIFNRAQV